MAEVAVFDWQNQMVKSFKEERSKSTVRRRDFDNLLRTGALDDSFHHNNMSVVRQLILQMRQQACDKTLTQFLDTVESMFRTVPEGRIYPWEAELDLMELTCATESEHTDLGIQRANVYTPEKKQQAEPQTALHRASIRGKKGRVIALLEAGRSAEVKDSAGILDWQLAERNGPPELRDILIRHGQEERINVSLFC